MLVEVGVVLYVFYTGPQVGSPAVDVQLAFDTGTELFIHIVIIPIEVVGVIMTHIERGQCIRDVAACIKVDGIFP